LVHKCKLHIINVYDILPRYNKYPLCVFILTKEMGESEIKPVERDGGGNG
jgi:hypothetical protein